MNTYVRKAKAPVQKRDAQRTNQLILSAARELFALQGYDDTPTAQIAERANVTEGAVFHHFKSKKDIFLRLAKNYGEECAEATVFLRQEDARLEDVVRAAFDFAERDRALYFFFKTVGPKLDQNYATPMSDAIVGVVQENLEWLIGRNLVRPMNTYIMAELQLALVEGSYHAWCKSGSEQDKEEYIREAARCMDAIIH